jgi:hypothetical protein
MIKIIIILIILFLLNNFYLKETFSNTPSFEWGIKSGKSNVSILNTNLIDSINNIPLLSLYFDRREKNCKYFYDFFSINYGGFSKTNDTNFLVPCPEESNGCDTSIRFEDKKQYSGMNEPWNQIKSLRATEDIFKNGVNMEEIEVDEYNLYDFNNKPAYKIGSDGKREVKEYKQFYRRDDFLDQIPLLTLTFIKEDEDNGYIEYDERNYIIKTYIYKGLYSPNNRDNKITVENIKKFIVDTKKKENP